MRLVPILLLLPSAALAADPDPSLLAPCGPEGSPHHELHAPRGGPPLLQDEETVDAADGFFRVHFTRTGPDRPENVTLDADDNGLPDYVDEVIAGLELGLAAFAEDGWRAPLPDLGLGGSEAIDLWIHELDANGRAHPIPGPEEEPASSCWMEVNNTMPPGDRVAESVALHELHHCVQYAYAPNPPPYTNSWLYEATATWQQYKHVRSAALDAAAELLWLMRLTDHLRPLADLDGRYEYAGMIFMKFWDEVRDGAGLTRGPDFWEAVRAQQPWPDLLESESQRLWGQGLDRTFLDFATWNAFACSRDDGAHYAREPLPCTLPTASVSFEDWDGATFLASHEDVTHTADFRELPADGDPRPLELSCEAPGPDAEARVRLVALDSRGRGGEGADLTLRDSESGRVRLRGALDPAGAVLVVTANTGGGPMNLSCSAARVEPLDEDDPEPEGGCACSGSGTGPSGWPAWALLPLIALRGRRRPSTAACAR